MEVRWLPVPGWENYYRVSTLGQITSFPRSYVDRLGRKMSRRERKVTGWTNHFGYLMVELSGGGQSETWLVHQVVLWAFVGPCPEGQQCRHLDGDKTNNHLTNLAWGTPKENVQDNVLHGVHPCGERGKDAKFKDSDIPLLHELYSSGMTCQDIADRYGVGKITIQGILSGKTYKHAQPSVPAKLRPNTYRPGNKTNGKLTAEDVAQVVAAVKSGEPQAVLAKKYGVSAAAICRAVNGRKRL